MMMITCVRDLYCFTHKLLSLKK